MVSALLELDESSERFRQLADDLELVTSFLENSDFREMRSDRPELSGGHGIHVDLTRDADAGEFLLSICRAPPVDTQ